MYLSGGQWSSFLELCRDPPWSLFIVIMAKTVLGRKRSFHFLGLDSLCVTIIKFQSMVCSLEASVGKEPSLVTCEFHKSLTGTDLPWSSPLHYGSPSLQYLTWFLLQAPHNSRMKQVSLPSALHAAPFPPTSFQEGPAVFQAALFPRQRTSYVHPQKLMFLNFIFIVVKHLSQKYQVTKQPQDPWGVALYLKLTELSTSFFSSPLLSPGKGRNGWPSQ